MVSRQDYNTWRIAVGERTVLAWNVSKREVAGYARERLADGVYPLARSGAIEVAGGRIIGTLAPACSSAWTVGRGRRGGIVLTRGSGAPKIVTRDGRVVIAVLDLADGELLIAIGDRVTRLAPDAGAAATAGGNGNPDFDLAEDFAP